MRALTYWHELRALAIGSLIAWRHLPKPLRDIRRALSDLFHSLIGLIVVVLAPLAFPFVPVLAYFSLRSEIKAMEAERAARERLRRGIHRNGRQP